MDITFELFDHDVVSLLIVLNDIEQLMKLMLILLITLLMIIGSMCGSVGSSVTPTSFAISRSSASLASQGIISTINRN